jgi:ADP-heptose:LPS heptosyltransferase
MSRDGVIGKMDGRHHISTARRGQAPAPAASCEVPERVLIIKLTSIGDVAHTIPASHALASHWPGTRLDWLVGRKAAPLVELLPWIRSAISYDLSLDEGLAPLVRRTREVVAELKQRRFDLAIDFQGLLRSSVWTALSGATRRAGRGRWPWLHVSVPMYDSSRTPHAIENTARPLSRLGLDLDGFLSVFEGEAVPLLASGLAGMGRDQVRKLRLRQPFWVWLPQSSWPSKSLPLHRLSGVPAGVTHLVIGDDSYREAPLPGSGDWLNVSGLPLPETAALCLLADRVIAADTGPAHLAALLGAPVIGCFGPTRAERTGVRGPRARNRQGACRGCRRRRCRHSAGCLLPALESAVAPEG